MEPINDDELEAYLDTEKWVGKAGAFGFQDGPNWISLETGSESNVVGLPMEMLASMLAEFKFDCELGKLGDTPLSNSPQARGVQ